MVTLVIGCIVKIIRPYSDTGSARTLGKLEVSVRLRLGALGGIEWR